MPDKRTRNEREVLGRRARLANPTPQPCEVCGDPRAVRHHPDYGKPEEIVWLCARHHQHAHNYHQAGLPSQSAKLSGALFLLGEGCSEQEAAYLVGMRLSFLAQCLSLMRGT
jgi:hypothetical protein